MPPVEKVINRQLLVDMIIGSGVFQSLGIVPNSHIVTNIQFSDLFGASDTELVKIKVFARKEQGVKVITH